MGPIFFAKFHKEKDVLLVLIHNTGKDVGT